MRKFLSYYCIFAVVLLFQTPLLNAQESNDWVQFRGNSRNGFSPETELLNTWPESGPELVFKKKIGCGFSELLVLKDKLYTMVGDNMNGTDSEYIASFDANTGEQLWKTKVDSIFIDPDDWGNGARVTPTVDEKYIYSVSSFGKLTANSVEDGKAIWMVDFVKEFGSTIPRWAFSSSPILVDNMLIVAVGGADNKTFVAFNKENGEVVWIKGNGRSEEYSSPVIAEIEGQEQIVFINDTMYYSFDSKGNNLWSHRKTNRGGSSSPLFIAPNKFFHSHEGRVGSVIIEINNNEAKEIMVSKTMQNSWSSVCYHNGYIYGFSRGKLECISEKDGALMWAKRGFGKGNLVVVDNKLVVLSDRGLLILVDTNPKEYTELDSHQAIEGKSWTALTIANGRVYIRNLTAMASYKLK